MKEARWSLRRRLGWWIALGTMAPVLVALAVGEVYVRSSLRREIAAFLEEETEEALAGLRSCPDPLSDFASLSRELASHHPEGSLAWWMRGGAEGQPVASFGEVSLIAGLAPVWLEPGAIADLGKHRFASTVITDDGHHLTLVADASSRLALGDRFRLFATVLMLVTGVASALLGRWVADRIGRTVERVARDIMAGKDAGEEIVRGDLPLEVAAVSRSLQTMLASIRRESREFKLMAAGLAHEMRSPVQNLTSEAEIALLRPRAVSDYQSILERQLDALKVLGDALGNLLSFCEVDGADSREPRAFDVAEEVRLRITRDQGRASRAGVRLNVSMSGTTEMVGDREAIMRAIRNVIANAVDWSPPAGAVDVQVEGFEDEVVVTVDDCGPGIAPERRHDLFEPFVRSESPRGGIGYGLGLSITKRAVESGGGHIEVGRSPAGGARFRLFLARRGRRTG